MFQKILATLCLTIILSFSFSASAWSQSVAPTPLLTPATIKVQQEIKTATANVEALRNRSDQVLSTRKEMTKELESFIVWEAEKGVSQESFPEIVKSLQSQRIDLMIDLAGLTAKREALLSAQDGFPGMQLGTTLANSLLDTSLELAEKKARQASIKSLLVDLLPARKKLESINALKTKSQKTLEQEIEITDKLNRSTIELNMLRKKLDELTNN